MIPSVAKDGWLGGKVSISKNHRFPDKKVVKQPFFLEYKLEFDIIVGKRFIILYKSTFWRNL